MTQGKIRTNYGNFHCVLFASCSCTMRKAALLAGLVGTSCQNQHYWTHKLQLPCPHRGPNSLSSTWWWKCHQCKAGMAEQNLFSLYSAMPRSSCNPCNCWIYKGQCAQTGPENAVNSTAKQRWELLVAKRLDPNFPFFLTLWAWQ